MGNAYYETADILFNRINMYLARVESGEIDIGCGVKLKNQKPSITGLALFLGFSSVSSFKNQASRGDDFAEVVAYGHLVIENHYEHLLQTEKLTKAGEVGLRRVGEWREAIDLALSGGSSHNIFIGEALKKWQELRAQRREQVTVSEPTQTEASEAPPVTPSTADGSPLNLSTT